MPGKHVRECSDPAWRRGQMAARIAVRAAQHPEGLTQVRRYAQSALEQAELGVAEAESRLFYARGFLAHLTALPPQETPA